MGYDLIERLYYWSHDKTPLSLLIEKVQINTHQRVKLTIHSGFSSYTHELYVLGLVTEMLYSLFSVEGGRLKSLPKSCELVSHSATFLSPNHDQWSAKNNGVLTHESRDALRERLRLLFGLGVTEYHSVCIRRIRHVV